MALRQYGSTLTNGMFLRIQDWFLSAGLDQVAIISHDYYATAYGGLDPIKCGDVAEQWHAAQATAVVSLLAVSSTYLGVKCFQLTPPPMPLPGIYDAIVPGAGGPTECPYAVAGMLTKQTLLSGPGYRGRVFFPGVPTNFVGTNNEPAPGYLTLLQTYGTNANAFTSVAVGLSVLTIQPVIYHRATRTGTSVIDYVARAKFGTQHRRGSYGRTNFGSIT